MPEDERRTTAVLPRPHDPQPARVPVEPVFYERRRRPAAPPAEKPATVVTTHEPAPPPPPADGRPRPIPASPPPPPVSPSSLQTFVELVQRWRTSVSQAWGIFGVGLLVGVVLAFTTGHSSKHTAQPAAPPAAGTKTPLSPHGQTAQPGAGLRQTPAPQAPPTTAAAPPTTAAAPRTVLLDIKRDSGSKTTQHFVAPSPRWTLGWAYDCTGQGAAGSFKVTILDANGTPSPDGGVDQQGAKGSSVAAYTSTGERYLSVQTTCLWAIRVTT
jgi:hypothetical protein